MIGTGHVFRIAEPVTFIVKNSWPDAVLVELDEKRYNSIMNCNNESKDSSSSSKIYNRTAKYQNKMAAENNVQTGSELFAAIDTGKLLGAEIIYIDKDAEKVMSEFWNEMSFFERRKYSWSVHTDNLFGKKKIDKTLKDFSANEEEFIEGMRKKYPTMVRKLIDERNEFMAENIRKASEKYENIVVVVGDAHVEGICKILGDVEIKKIRLAELMDKDSMDNIRSQIWNGKEVEQ